MAFEKKRGRNKSKIYKRAENISKSTNEPDFFECTQINLTWPKTRFISKIYFAQASASKSVCSDSCLYVFIFF